MGIMFDRHFLLRKVFGYNGRGYRLGGRSGLSDLFLVF